VRKTIDKFPGTAARVQKTIANRARQGRTATQRTLDEAREQNIVARKAAKGEPWWVGGVFFPMLLRTRNLEATKLRKA
jgi:hypothetical protein